jgi:RNA polymerase sigma-70 factor (ECF subfamily)
MAANEAELKSLMVKALEGESLAYRALLDVMSRYLRAFFRVKLLGQGGSATEAEDLVQEVLLAIHTRRHTFDPDKPFTPWMHAIARYKLIDYLRRTRGAYADVPLDEVIDLAVDVDTGQAESGHDLQKLMKSLPEKMQRAIQYVKIDGLSVAEAAKRTSTSESAIKVNIHRGLKALAATVAREEKS